MTPTSRLLAGDAARVHSPTGGQGLNIGVQDAVNLGWKLGQVVQGTSPESLLDTYHAERHPVGARALKLTMALTALNRGDERTNALREPRGELSAMDEPRKRYAGAVGSIFPHSKASRRVLAQVTPMSPYGFARPFAMYSTPSAKPDAEVPPPPARPPLPVPPSRPGVPPEPLSDEPASSFFLQAESKTEKAKQGTKNTTPIRGSIQIIVLRGSAPLITRTFPRKRVSPW